MCHNTLPSQPPTSRPTPSQTDPQSPQLPTILQTQVPTLPKGARDMWADIIQAALFMLAKCILASPSQGQIS